MKKTVMNPILKIKEYGIISQWVLIYRSKDYFKVERMIAKGNEQYWEDYQKALDRGEKPADNQLFLVKIYEQDEN